MQPFARFGDVVATDLQEVSHDPAALDRGGWWAVVHTYEGHLTAARFGRVERGARHRRRSRQVRPGRRCP